MPTKRSVIAIAMVVVAGVVILAYVGPGHGGGVTLYFFVAEVPDDCRPTTIGEDALELLPRKVAETMASAADQGAAETTLTAREYDKLSSQLSGIAQSQDAQTCAYVLHDKVIGSAIATQ